ncbi:hypothetical protein M5X00_29370 [Paenibacillus alvei]|uniref:hypothetical protein n=1 Tax=Paenibacillus alvei TaxID=44250 RepID=UPI002281926A|nr:hypothetical protein [Paenibacillus alvei]MCY9708137.1 hypothetical protein [Paenibacillus alvei]MCY9738227.1 hypothetical protein [Paenibacillus alvei]MCY9758330.1 hypothetical protein [Paenibacillus alvei]
MNKIQKFFFTLSVLFFVSMAVHNLWKVITALRNPSQFSVAPIFWMVLMLFILLGHIALYVFTLDRHKKIREIYDDEEWWTKWDRV